MRKLARLHSWRLKPRAAIELQRGLRERIIDSPIRPWPRLVAGADIAYSKSSNTLVAAVIVFSLPEMIEVERVIEVRKAAYPYVPGLLTFREGPAILAAFARLKQFPDAVIFDGQGRAHPRGMGIAAHMGLWLGLPTIGCAKSRLCGDEEMPGPERGDYGALRLDGKIIGRLLRTKRNVNPVYVSAGHLSNLRDSVRLVLECCRGFRLPEPTRQAHITVTALRSQLPAVNLCQR